VFKAVSGAVFTLFWLKVGKTVDSGQNGQNHSRHQSRISSQAETPETAKTVIFTDLGGKKPKETL